MFDNIEELEREVQKFRENILASSELVVSFESMMTQMKAQTKAFEAASSNLQDCVKAHTEEVQKQIDQMSASIEQRMTAQSEGFASATQKLETVVGQKTEEFGARADSTLAAQVDKLTAANQTQICVALDMMEKTNREFAAKCEEASKSFVAVQEDLNARYEQVLTKLDAANASEAVRLSKAIINSLNVKFAILLIGVVASVTLAVLAYIQ